MHKKNFMVLALVGLVTVACSTSPTGRSQFMPFKQDLSQMGADSFEEIKKREKIAQDPALNRYVKCVSDHIVRQVDLKYGYQPGQWEVVVFDSEQVNAFALPGAKIGVYTGLLQIAKTQAQLASVIGHEVGHVLANHANERMNQQMAAGLLTVVAGAVLSGNEDRDTYMAALGVGTSVGILLPFSRTHESESDEIGQELMAKAGFNPQGAVEMWKNMAKVSGGKNPPELLSTHPAPQSRIEALTKKLSKYTPIYQQAKAQGRNPGCARPE